MTIILGVVAAYVIFSMAIKLAVFIGEVISAKSSRIK